jgi:hypothetical protein
MHGGGHSMSVLTLTEMVELLSTAAALKGRLQFGLMDPIEQTISVFVMIFLRWPRNCNVLLASVRPQSRPFWLSQPHDGRGRFACLLLFLALPAGPAGCSLPAWSPWPNPGPESAHEAAPGGVCGGPKAICPDPPGQDRAFGFTALSWEGG